MTTMSALRDRARARMTETISGLRANARDHAPDAVREREAGYRIVNADTSDGEAVVRIYDEIWWLGVNAQDLAADLEDITAPKIRVDINSPGGDVFDGITIYNALRSHPAHITTRIDGIAASIASVIAQAGDTRLVQETGQMMIHNAWGMTVGDNRDHTDMAALLEQQDGILADIYARHATGDAGHFRELMNAETWLTAERIVDEGLADAIFEPPEKPDASASIRKFSEHGESVITDLTEFVTRAEGVVTFRAEQGKTPATDETVDLIARIRGEADRLATLTQPTPPEATDAPDMGPVAADALRALMAKKYIA